MKFGSLFSGIGGLDLGLERAGMECVWQVELDEYARKVLAKHWPNVTRYSNVEYVHGPDDEDHCTQCLEPVDLLAGGFPCQPFSTASRGRRVAEDLWPEMLRVVRDLRPRFVIAENVSFDAIKIAGRDLTAEGYTCGVVFLSAALVGAPHERPRWFVVADSDGDGEPLRARYSEMASVQSMAAIEAWASVPERLGMAYGVPRRMDRLRGLGNAVVPVVAERIGRLIMEAA